MRLDCNPQRGGVAVLDALPVQTRAGGDANQVVERFGILRYPSETLDLSFAGVEGG
jgi:hypothetical protein